MLKHNNSDASPEFVEEFNERSDNLTNHILDQLVEFAESAPDSTTDDTFGIVICAMSNVLIAIAAKGYELTNANEATKRIMTMVIKSVKKEQESSQELH